MLKDIEKIQRDRDHYHKAYIKLLHKSAEQQEEIKRLEDVYHGTRDRLVKENRQLKEYVDKLKKQVESMVKL